MLFLSFLLSFLSKPTIFLYIFDTLSCFWQRYLWNSSYMRIGKLSMEASGLVCNSHDLLIPSLPTVITQVKCFMFSFIYCRAQERLKLFPRMFTCNEFGDQISLLLKWLVNNGYLLLLNNQCSNFNPLVIWPWLPSTHTFFPKSAHSHF